MAGDLLSRFHSKIKLNDNGCHEWTAYKDKYGYGQFSDKHKTYQAHRLSYMLYKGKIPDDLEIHHICENTSCVNQYHFKVISPIDHARTKHLSNNGENHRSKTHCPQGHEYNEKNTYIGKKGRQCRICKRKNQKEYERRLAKETSLTTGI